MEPINERQHKRIVIMAIAIIIIAGFSLVSQFRLLFEVGAASLSQVITISSTSMMMVAGLISFAVSRSSKDIQAVRRLAYVDDLTGLMNRRRFYDILKQELARCRRSGDSIALIMLDLDRFKVINDCHGHEAGDQIIRQFGTRIQDALCDEDTLCRISGDEFVLLIHNIQNDEHIHSVGKRVQTAMKEPFKFKERHIYAGVSMGAAAIHNGELYAAQAMRMADFALLRSKEQGRGRLVLFDPEMAARIKYRSEMEIKLREAIATQSMSLRYQPLVNQDDGTMSGVEALVRWTHAEDGEIPPSEFIPLAEELALMEDIGNFVLKQACTEVKSIKGIRLAVNIASAQFMRDSFVKNVEAILKETGFEPARLELEITQELLMANSEAVKQKLEQFRNIGVRVALDDFGTGYSSMFFLREFKLDRIKLDRSFVKNMQTEPDGERLIANMIAMGSTLGTNVTVEGVETEDQLTLLRNMGCHELQGFLFSKPLTATELNASRMIEELEANARWNEEYSAIQADRKLRA